MRCTSIVTVLLECTVSPTVSHQCFKNSVFWSALQFCFILFFVRLYSLALIPYFNASQCLMLQVLAGFITSGNCVILCIQWIKQKYSIKHGTEMYLVFNVCLISVIHPSVFVCVQSSSLVLWHCLWPPSPWLRCLLCSTISLKYDLMPRNLWLSCEDQWQQEPKTLVGYTPHTVVLIKRYSSWIWCGKMVFRETNKEKGKKTLFWNPVVDPCYYVYRYMVQHTKRGSKSGSHH